MDVEVEQGTGLASGLVDNKVIEGVVLYITISINVIEREAT